MLDMFGNMKAQQEEMATKLAAIEVSVKSEDGLVQVKVNGQKDVLDISINEEVWIEKDVEQLQDMLVITLNKAFDEINVQAEEVTNQALNDLIPGGMGGLGSLFGGGA